MNGVIILETRDKVDRQIAKNRAIELLEKGGNLLIFPEGAWNITENLPVMKLFSGTVEMAITVDAEIIPMSIEQKDKSFYISFGENIKYSDCTISQKEELTLELRDILSTLTWNIWESFEHSKRDDITEKFRENYVQSIIDKCDYGYTAQDVLETKFKDKSIVEIEEVDSYKQRLRINRNNAFLFKK